MRFEEAASSPEGFIDYIYSLDHSYEDEIVQCWRIDEKYINILKDFPAEEVLSAFSRTLERTKSRRMIDLIFELCARVLGKKGADFVRARWDRYHKDHFSYGLSLAAFRCLPHEEGFRLIADALAKMECSELSRYRSCLIWFKTSWALDWIEENIRTPVDFVWGAIAAESRFNWHRARKWLDSGRPLSIVALDALSLCLQRRSMGKRHDFRMPDIDELVSTLRNYLKHDDTPGIRERISYIISLV
ncbi:MAG: hypothetical protein GXO97_09630 [Nitrospirae bacterium]|nr:hypothetical protein [Nitrospirota bacterium]